ncbi:diguanylate cyclase (GGDEF)-like protein [Lysobacter sp. OAE881]|uniref:GGDEF domain-containing protein n=1 Tax=Lysobacter sp. OAE881 TaxID=2663813 RepID=UPI00178B9CC1
MKINRMSVLLSFMQERLGSLNARARSASLSYWHLRKWFQVDGTEVADKELRGLLDAARKSPTGYSRPSKDRRVLFWIQKFEAVAIVEFDSAIYAPAQGVAKRALDRIVDDSINEYRATHDTHTGLKNRVAFDQALLDEIGRMPSNSATTVAQDASQSAPEHSVVLASLDIDHFKTINDRFGHGYGDMVLAALAARMEAVGIEVVSESGGKVSVEVFRLGGEEFQVLISGPVSEQEGGEVANRISQAIRGDLLPNKKEYEWLSRTEFADGTPLPHDSDRKVTVSVGVATALVTRDKPSEVAKRLKRQADLALYSAKIGGRDRVRHFLQILDSGGRVSFIDQNNGILSIDIGREVGVKKGQEFFLYPPKYAGNTDFFLGEGRSRKRMGMYPKFRAARVAAFDVQNDVSFCRVVERERGVREIEEGSTLEAIPLGSISHLIGELDGVSKFEAQEAFRQDVATMATKGGVAVIAVSLNDIERISEEKGLDKANECLGRVGQHVLASLKSKGKFGQASLGGFLAAINASSPKEVGQLAKSLFDGLSAQVDGVSFGVGWAFQAQPEVVKEGEEDGEEGESGGNDKNLLNDVRGLVDAALLAAIESAERKAAARFTVALWATALARVRKAGEYNRLMADFELFSGLGLSSPYAETQMAFLYSSGPKRNAELAESMFRQAASRPEIPLIRANLGCYLIAAGKIEEGFDIVRDMEMPESYMATLFYGALRALNAEGFAAFVESKRAFVPRAMEGERVWLSNKELNEISEALKVHLSERVAAETQ